MISRLIKRWRRQDNSHSPHNPPPPPKREREDTSSMADLVRLLEREQEPAE
jgi:hypothetical protein